MGYKQHNNPFSRKISSPLKHNVRNAQGQPWRHTHTDKGFTGTYDTGRVIQGQSTFGQKPDKKFKGGRSEREIAMEYANQLANYYNQGAITGGNFRADDYDKIRNFKRSDKSRGFLSKLTGVDIYRDQYGRVVVDRGRKNKGTGATNQYNIQQGEWDGEKGVYKNAPTEQVTPEQIYDMMVQGGGLVSIVDGKIVAGNPNESTYMRTRDFRSDESLPKGFTTEQLPRRQKGVYYRNGVRYDFPINDYDEYKIIANPDYEEQMKVYNSFYDEKSDSPLNQGHETNTDERSDGPKDGFIYTPGEPVVVERIEEVLDENGNVIGTNKIIDTTITNTGQREVPAVADTPDDGPSFAEDCKGIVMNVGNVSRSGRYKCDLNPNPTPTPTVDPPEPTIETDSYDTTTSETIFTPIEVEEPELIPPPSLEIGVPGSIKSTGGDFRFHIPDIDLMGGIRAVIDGVVFTNKGRCKAGCATNKNS